MVETGLTAKREDVCNFNEKYDAETRFDERRIFFEIKKCTKRKQ